MILFTLLLIIGAIVAIMACIGGAAFFVVFADWIVFGAILWVIYKLFFKKDGVSK